MILWHTPAIIPLSCPKEREDPVSPPLQPTNVRQRRIIRHTHAFYIPTRAAAFTFLAGSSLCKLYLTLDRSKSRPSCSNSRTFHESSIALLLHLGLQSLEEGLFPGMIRPRSTVKRRLFILRLVFPVKNISISYTRCCMADNVAFARNGPAAAAHPRTAVRSVLSLWTCH